jgi:hypothetical protein
MSTDVTSAPDSVPAEPAPARKQGSTFRIVLILLLVLAIVALIFDRRSQAAAKELHDSLNEMIREHMSKTGPMRQMPTVDAVHEHIGREPSEAYDHEDVPNTKVEEYHYRGGLPWRSYVVYVYYRTRPDVRLDAVSLNQALTKDEL